LACGIVRWQTALDWLIARRTDGRPQQMALQILLRLGLYQMFWLDRIPDHAAVNETVELAKRLGHASQAGFLNAVLRGFLRDRPQTEALLQQLKDTEPATAFSHPQWLCDRWQARWGPARLRQLLEWNNTPAPVYARLNTQRSDPAKLAEQWTREGVEFEPRAWDWCDPGLVFEMKALPPLANMASFQQGWFYVQDPSTLLAVRLLDPQPGDNVLDCCAAPGGKTTYIAQLMQDRGLVIAEDLQVDRRRLINENCQRLGLTCVRLAEAASAASTPEARFDRVLVDVPCSNTGVMRRRVDLRWRVELAEIERLRDEQLQLLTRAAATLAKGGTLVYSTCSLEPEENRQVVDAFLQAHPDFSLDRDRELLPFVEGVDGAYAARLTRR
jgi:16S rRNA (cytosine967-C5)-methyltransferase